MHIMLWQGKEVKMDLLHCVLSWKQKLSMPEVLHSKTEGARWTPELGRWLAQVRQTGLSLSSPSEVSEVDSQRLSELLCTLSMAAISPRDVLMVCLAGSRLYNLALPTSDKDYIVVFRQPTVELLSSIVQKSVSSCRVGR